MFKHRDLVRKFRKKIVRIIEDRHVKKDYLSSGSISDTIIFREIDLFSCSVGLST